MLPRCEHCQIIASISRPGIYTIIRTSFVNINSGLACEPSSLHLRWDLIDALLTQKVRAYVSFAAP